MVVQAEQDRVKHLLTEALPMLCKNGLSFSSEFCIEALIGITLDKNDVFLVSIKETVKSEADDGTPEKSIDVSVSKVSPEADEGVKSSSRRKQHRKRRRSKGSSKDSDSENDVEDSEGQTDIKREKMETTGVMDDYNNTSNDMSTSQEDINHRIAQTESSPDAIIVKEEPVESDFSVSFGEVSAGHGFDMSSYSSQGTVGYSQSSPHILQKHALSNTLSPSSEQSLPGTSYGQALPGTGQREAEGQPKEASMDIEPRKPGDNENNADDEKDEGSPGEPKKEDPTEQFMAVATEGRLWMCVICSKLCNQRQNLKRHINGVHLKTQRFGCKFCGKEFIYQDSKIRHERRCSGNPNPNPRMPSKKKSTTKPGGLFYGNQYTSRPVALSISDVHSVADRPVYAKGVGRPQDGTSPVDDDEIVLSSSDTDMPESYDNGPLRDGFPLLDPLGEPIKRIAQDIL